MAREWERTKPCGGSTWAKSAVEGDKGLGWIVRRRRKG